LELSNLNFIPLDGNSPISTFDCGLEDITSFLRENALAYQTEKMANTYLFKDNSHKVLAFFSISNDCLNDLGEQKVKRGLCIMTWKNLLPSSVLAHLSPPMSSSQKPTNDKNAASTASVTSVNENPSPRKAVNKFAGMGARAVMVEPVIIPGYKIRG